VLHTTGGYLVYLGRPRPTSCVFDYRPGDVFWCTADVGWVTGHSYVVYGPLANRAHHPHVRGRAQLSPTHARFWEVIDKHEVDIFYTAPTAIRALMRVPATSRSSRRSSQVPRCACSARSASRSTRKPG
jgi:acetyl-CoA synthetase